MVCCQTLPVRRLKRLGPPGGARFSSYASYRGGWAPSASWRASLGTEAGNTDGHGSSDLLDNDVGMVEGGSVGGDVVWVARENLGGTVKRGSYDD